MAQNQSPLFSFASSGLDEKTFQVVRFTGHEGLSTLYQFEIVLISSVDNLDLSVVIKNIATFTLQSGDQTSSYHGMVMRFEQMQKIDDFIFYRAVLVPRLWRLTQAMQNQIFLDKKPKDFLKTCIISNHFSETDFELKINNTAVDPWDYVCQYNESPFHFISRWMEKYGIYYYFDQTGDQDVMVCTDTRMAHTPLTNASILRYLPSSGQQSSELVVQTFTLEQNALPQQVRLKDYNYETPSLALNCTATVKSDGIGEVYVYGSDFRTDAEGTVLAKLRAEEILCREKLFHASSDVPFITPGYTFTLTDHYSSSFNTDYLITKVSHEGSQAQYLTAGLKVNLGNQDANNYYSNTFTCIPATTQYRPALVTEQPKCYGTLNAKIDAATDTGTYAELDDQGRYKVILPFDLSGLTGGKASAWVRMAQPYGGSDHGLHFPLHKGAEVLLTFINGNPDHPTIQGSVPNPLNPSVINSTTQQHCQITTGGQNKILIEDTAGQEFIQLSSPYKESKITVGYTPPTPPEKTPWYNYSGTKKDDSGDSIGISVTTSGPLTFTSNQSIAHVLGNSFKVIAGATETTQIGAEIKANLVEKFDFVMGWHQVIRMAKKIEYTSDAFYLRPKKAAATAKKSELDAVVDRLHGEVSTVSGKVSNLAAKHDHLAIQTSCLATETSNLAAEVNTLEGKHNALAGDVSDLSGTTNKLTGAMRKLVNDTFEVGTSKSEFMATTKTVRAELSQITGKDETIQGQASTIATNTNLISGSVIIM